VGEGTGLGLAIARWIAQEHGGRISASNNPQGGAAFTVVLPSAA
jgi:signal transduction histidine kinase